MYSYWSFLGLFYLCLLTWQDYRNNMMVDDRRNWFMMGLSVSLISHIQSPILYKLALALVLFLLYNLLVKIKLLGRADINSFAWIFLGFGLMSPIYLFVFTIMFVFSLSIFYFIKNVIYKNKYPAAFYGVILVSYISSCFILGVY